MDERIAKLLTLAISAPSGDNCQPWRFTIADRQLKVFNVPERDTSLYNFRQLATMVAHGALIENIRIASPSFGLQAEVKVLPETGKSNLVATIEFQDGAVFEDPLFSLILKRCTNRKPYHGLLLTESQRSILLQTGDLCPGVKMYIASDQGEIKTLARIVSNNDRLVFENRYLHDFLFDHIRWSDEEAKVTLDGLDLKTFEMGGLDGFGFKMMKSWALVDTFNKLGLSKMVAKQAEKLCKSASGIGVVTTQDNKAEDFLLGGRAMQRLWLEATRLGLSFQPIAGIAFMMQRVLAGATEELAPQQVKLIKDVRENVSQTFALGQDHIVMMFRIGTSTPPTARSLRLPLEKFT